ncbi:MAG: hypothetical protein IJ493_11150 [Clostridia bacterium]|nr:hypothetical protein [Clostridia bacterium]
MKRVCLIMCAFLCLLLTACGESVPELSRVTNVYAAVPLEFPEDISLQQLHATADGFAAVGVEKVGDQSRPVLLTYDAEGRLLSDTRMETPEGEDFYQPSYAVDAEGALYCILVRSGQRSIVCFHNGVSSVFVEDAADLLGKNSTRLQQIAVDADGRLCLVTDSLLVVTENGKILAEHTPGMNLSLSGGRDGRVYVTYCETATGNNLLCRIDGEALSETERAEGLALANTDYFVDADGAVYLDNADGLYWMNGGTDLLCSWVNSDVIHDSIRDVTVLNEDTLALIYAEPSGGETVQQLLYMTRIPDDQVPEKYLIEVAVGTVPENIRRMIVNFNRGSDEYRAVLTAYSSYNTTDNPTCGETMLRNEIIAGDIPDVMLLSQFTMRSEYLASGMFADLYALMDADPDFDRSRLFDCVLTPFERDGRLYELITRFSLSTLARLDSVDADGWTLDEFLDTAEALPDGSYVTWWSDPQRTLELLLTGALTDFVDEEHGRCSFDSDIFRRLLTFAKEQGTYNLFSTPDGDAYRDARYKMYTDGRVMVTESGFGSLYQYVKVFGDLGLENVCVGGYPSEGSGVIVNPAVSWAIAKKSPVKDGAWQLVKSMLYDAADPDDRESSFYFASEKGMFESELTGTNAVGTTLVFSRNSVSSYTDAARVPSGSMARTIMQSDVEALYTLFDAVKALPAWNDEVMAIIIEEAAMFFAGDKSLDDTIKIIQNRCSTYFAEQS